MDGRNSTEVLLQERNNTEMGIEVIYESSTSTEFYEISLQENDRTNTRATTPDGKVPDSSFSHQQQQHPSVAFYKLFCFADALDCLLIFCGAVGACVHGAAMPVFFIFFGKLIDSFGSNHNNSDLMQRQVSKYALYFIYLGLVVLGAGWLEVSCWMQTGERQATKMRAEYLRAMLNQDVGFFDTDATTGEIVSCISGDTLLVQDAISEKVGNFIHYIARFTAGFAVGFSCIWQLTLVTLAVVPAIALAGSVYALIMVGLTSRSQKAYAKAGQIADEAISQVRTVYSFVGERRAMKMYSKALGTTLKLGESSGLAKGLGVGSTYGLLFGAWALLLWYASVLVQHGTANGGQALTTILSVIVGGIALGQAAPNLTAFGKGKAAGYNVLEMIRRQKSSSSSRTSGDKILPALDGHVEFRNVCFSYPSRPDVTIFQRFCLSIPAGKTVAIVGGSGSGKSTVISLIERFYDPISGKVLLDGEDIKLLDLKWLRLQIGLVNQEPALFATSILENILYGKENATMEEVEEAAKIANTHSFIEQLPDGYNTQVGERGVQLSGGQKQRIAIARAMLKNPKLLLLDEATSALDAASERNVQDALDRLMVGRTTVIVAHRLSTVRNADTIAVLNLGRIVEIGTHDELVCRGETGAYNSLVKLQEPLMNKRGDEACINGRVSRGSSLSHRNFSFHSSIRSETNSTSMYMEQEEMGYQRIKGSMSLYWRLFKMNMPEWPYTVLGSLGAIMAGTETPLFALAVSQVLITYYFPDNGLMKTEVRKYALIFTGASLATVLIYVLQHYSFAVMGERLTMRIREKLFSAILRNEVGWFDCDENNSSILASRLSSDATFVRASIGDRMSTIVQNLALIVTSFLIAFIIEWHVTLVILATFPFIIGAALGEHLFLKGFGGDLASEYSKASIVAGEAVSNIRTVAAFCAEDKVLRLFTHKLKVPEQKSFIRGHIAGIGYGLSQLCMFSSYALALWYSSKLVADHKTKFGNVMKAFMVLVITAFGIAETLALAPDIVKGSQALSSVFEILDRQSQIDPDDKHAEEVSKVKGEVELSNVDFSYPMRPGNMILRDFSFRVKAGQSFALVGASGSGKSSVVALISRFYDPISGKVMVDGRDIRRFNLRSLRQHIGLVQQEPALFMTNIYENILYGREGATEAEVMEAAKGSNAHGFISALPNGYRTAAGERGVQLSGGQKQRIAIARAVLKDPGILLLDEATSALDAESEKVVQQALDRLMKGRTTIVIAHRLSTIRNTDRIAVLQDGKIVEQGSYMQLMSQNGSFAKLHYLQQQSGGLTSW